MQKITCRPICHLSFQEANSVFQEIRLSQPLNLSQPSIQRNYDQPQYPNSIVSNNKNFAQPLNNTNQKFLNQSIRNNRLNSLPENVQFNLNIPNSQNYPPFGHPLALLPGQNKENQKIIQKESIIRKYDDFFGEKTNFQMLKQENSRLYYEKLALQASVQKLKEENIKKDHEISKLREILDSNKITQVQQQKSLHGYQTQILNQASPQIHFRHVFQQKNQF